jgi:AraC-like DNA-binding protein
VFLTGQLIKLFMSMVIYVKNMVCVRCKMVVQSELAKLGLHPIKVELGEAVIQEDISAEYLAQLNMELQKSGLEILKDNKNILAEKIKTAIIQLVYEDDAKLKINLSDYLSDKLHYNYTYLNNVFYKTQGLSIEKYMIAQKIERVKELLAYNELNLTEIAFRMNYSSVAHLSNQFKKVTGMNATEYRLISYANRKAIDQIM